VPILLFRVDERLIHGQVLIGWGSQLRPDRYLVVDDELADSQWEQELYRLGLPEGAEAVFSSVDEARDQLGKWKDDAARSVLLTRDVRSMRRLGEGGGLRGERVNLGGLHHGPGRERVLNYLHLSPADRSDLLGLRDEGAEVSARDVPSASRVKLDALLEKVPAAPEEGEE
jgi:PTS system mannose-specific IIB component/fructoselysine and glucoselysine-specific PTS system IIB component